VGDVVAATDLVCLLVEVRRVFDEVKLSLNSDAWKKVEIDEGAAPVINAAVVRGGC